MKSFIISAGTFPFDVMLHFGTKAQAKKEISKYYTKKEDIKDIDGFFEGTYVASYMMLSDNKSFIHFPNFQANAQHYGILVHELLHATFAILNHVKVEYTQGRGEGELFGSEEVFTYLLQHLTTLTLHELEDMEF